MSDEDDIIAAEIALGVLGQAELTAAQARMSIEPQLADRVEWWRDRFTALTNEASGPPSAQLWTRIVQALPQNDNAPSALRRWQAGAVAASLVAAILGAVLLTRAPVVRTVPVVAVTSALTPLLARLGGAHGASATLAYDRASGQLTIAPGALGVGKRAAELWIIPADGTPRSLGVIEAVLASSHTVIASRRALIMPGSSFAISAEPAGGSPSGLPTGPVVASGKIIGV